MAGNASPPRQQRPPTPPLENVEVADMPVPRMSPSLGRFAPAFVRVQAAIQPVIKARTNPAFKGDRPVTYADLASILEEALPILAANGFGLMQFPSTENNQLALMSMLIHESGEFVSATMPLLLQKADPQGEGSAISYGRRYAACAILGIRTIDDDGNEASGRSAQPPPARRPASMRNQPADEPPEDAPQPKEGWATIEAEASAHKAAAEQIKQLYAIVGEDHPVRKQLTGYRELNGWPMPANALMNLSMIVAKAHGEATASAGQEQTTEAPGSEGRPESPAPSPEAPSVPSAVGDGQVAAPEPMPWDGAAGPAPDSLSVCPWCEKEVEKGKPSVITGGTKPDDPAVRYHKGCYDEKTSEEEA